MWSATKQEGSHFPHPYPFLPPPLLRKDLAKPYDPKRAVWTPDGNGGFTEGVVQVMEIGAYSC